MVEVNKAHSIRMAVSASLAAASLLISGAALAGNGQGSDAIGGTGLDKVRRGPSTNAIGGTGLDAIGGTGLDKVRRGPSTNAIGGTGLDAIGGTGLDKVRRGPSTNAIGGTGLDAIGGTGLDAIGGTGLDAIGGTGLDAIGGTGLDKVRRGPSTNAIGGTGVDAIGGTGLDKVPGAALVLKGPVEKVNPEAGTITVLGRHLAVPVASKLVEKIGNALSAGNTVEIVIFGQVDASGRLQRASAAVTEGQYVPGVTKVVVSGKVSSINTTVATAVVNGVTIDYSAALAGRIPKLSVGDVATFVGTLPQTGQQMLASTVLKPRK